MKFIITLTRPAVPSSTAEHWVMCRVCNLCMGPKRERRKASMDRANEGLSMVAWVVISTLIVLLILGGVLWWWDGYIIKG